MRNPSSRSSAVPAALALAATAMLLGGCVVDHRGPGWYHYGHRWHHRPPPAGVVVD